jgi:hypothetical protein
MWFDNESRVFRRMGFVADQRGIMRRYSREKDGWDPHLNRSRDYIRRSIAGATGGRVAVLGSGWLLDVPLEDLLAQFDSVHLYDIVHPVQILHRYSRVSAVKFYKEDLTAGFAKEIFFLGKDKAVEVESLKVPVLKGLETYDKVISINLLNQLDTLIIDFLKRKNKAEDTNLISLRARIQQAHLDALPLGKSILITDHEEMVVDHKSRQETTHNLVHCPIPRNETTEEWIWQFDTRGMYYPGKTTQLRVIASCF